MCTDKSDCSLRKRHLNWSYALLCSAILYYRHWNQVLLVRSWLDQFFSWLAQHGAIYACLVCSTSYKWKLLCSYLFQVRQENFLTISLHMHFTLLYWYIFNEGSFPGSVWVFSSFLHKEHNGWLASSPGRSQILSHHTREKSVLQGWRIKSGSALGTRLAANYTSNEEMMKTILNIINETQDWSVTKNKVWSWRTSVAMWTYAPK